MQYIPSLNQNVFKASHLNTWKKKKQNKKEVSGKEEGQGESEIGRRKMKPGASSVDTMHVIRLYLNKLNHQKCHVCFTEG